ncbi:MAG: TonB-dependent receptor [Thermoanaerobaculia bacterium]
MTALRTLILAGLVFLMVAVPSNGQGSGSLAGTVAREDGSGIGGVTVVVNELGLAEITRSDGSYSISQIAAGTYSITFTLGSNVQVEEGVEVAAGATTRLETTVDWSISFAETIVVMSASRRAERIVEVPAAISVITALEIKREASHGQLPKLLEFTPGAEVTQSGIYDYNLNTRGFNSSLNRRVATLIDGRDPSVPFLGAQEWAALSFPLDDLASLEMVRGPSAALYGANASSGVLNMTTKAPRDSQGGTLRLTAGELNTTNADLRWAGSLGSEWYLKAVGGIRQSDDFSRSRRGQAEYAVPCTVSGQIECLPQEGALLSPTDVEITFGALRLDKNLSSGKLFTIEGGQSTVKGPIFQTGIGRVQVVALDRPWARTNFYAERWNLLAYYNKRDASKQTALAAGTNLTLNTENYQVELQGNWDLADGRARIVLGGAYSEDDIDSFDPTQGAQTLMFEPVSSDQQALFGQLDWEFSDKVKLVVAGRWDDSTLHDARVSPKAALVFGLSHNSTLRLTYNEAFQVPNYSEFFLQANVAAPLPLQAFEAFCTPFGVSCGFAPGPTRILALGNKDLELEEIKTIELGYSGILGGSTYLTVDYYNSKSENFITDLLPQLGTALGRTNPNFGPYTPPADLPAPVAAALLATLQGALGPAFFILTNNVDGTPILGAVSYSNFGKVDTQGIDIGLNHYFQNDWTFSLSYSWFDFDVKEDLPGFDSLLLPNTPENKLSVGMAYVGSRFDAGFDARWVDKFRWAVGPFVGDVESYVTADLNSNYQLNDNWSVGVSIANLFDEKHFESFGGDILERRALGNVVLSW